MSIARSAKMHSTFMGDAMPPRPSLKDGVDCSNFYNRREPVADLSKRVALG